MPPIRGQQAGHLWGENSLKREETQQFIHGGLMDGHKPGDFSLLWDDEWR